MRQNWIRHVYAADTQQKCARMTLQQPKSQHNSIHSPVFVTERKQFELCKLSLLMVSGWYCQKARLAWSKITITGPNRRMAIMRAERHSLQTLSVHHSSHLNLDPYPSSLAFKILLSICGSNIAGVGPANIQLSLWWIFARLFQANLVWPHSQEPIFAGSKCSRLDPVKNW